MKVAAIICEYNPFHNGHEYLIQSAKEQTKADYIIAIMSGNFVQRGEPAIIDKWARAKSCLRAGVDMVVASRRNRFGRCDCQMFGSP